MSARSLCSMAILFLVTGLASCESDDGGEPAKDGGSSGGKASSVDPDGSSGDGGSGGAGGSSPISGGEPGSGGKTTAPTGGQPPTEAGTGGSTGEANRDGGADSGGAEAGPPFPICMQRRAEGDLLQAVTSGNPLPAELTAKAEALATRLAPVELDALFAKDLSAPLEKLLTDPQFAAAYYDALAGVPRCTDAPDAGSGRASANLVAFALCTPQTYQARVDSLADECVECIQGAGSRFGKAKCWIAWAWSDRAWQSQWLKECGECREQGLSRCYDAEGQPECAELQHNDARCGNCDNSACSQSFQCVGGQCVLKPCEPGEPSCARTFTGQWHRNADGVTIAFTQNGKQVTGTLPSPRVQHTFTCSVAKQTATCNVTRTDTQQNCTTVMNETFTLSDDAKSLSSDILGTDALCDLAFSYRESSVWNRVGGP